eukprot:CAMPEP_0177636510 /NCGR_PEP_ID=MMETSP0447-20121125/4478_1 /TAXON_ID=0 /ORGANISM="Stygamoeba regulata, Strain BSH-02190019" /LENGTH=84 /DNA_ID=CAMNT_0019138379 /DNA_START=77 /DNA_END=328 /DNA_ORIENTATION=-
MTKSDVKKLKNKEKKGAKKATMDCNESDWVSGDSAAAPASSKPSDPMYQNAGIGKAKGKLKGKAKARQQRKQDLAERFQDKLEN